MHHATRESSFEEVLHFLVDVVDARFFSLVFAVVYVIAFERAAATASFNVVVVAIDESSLPARAGKSPTKDVLKVVLVLLVSNIICTTTTTRLKFVVVVVFGRKEERKGKGRRRRVLFQKSPVILLFFFILFFPLVEGVQLFVNLVSRVALEPGAKPRGERRRRLGIIIVVVCFFLLPLVFVRLRWRSHGGVLCWRWLVYGEVQWAASPRTIVY